MKALVFNKFGGPEVLEYLEISDPVIGPDEILVRMKAIGLNFADIYRRKGNYHLTGNSPFILGYEGAGVVEKRERMSEESALETLLHLQMSLMLTQKSGCSYRKGNSSSRDHFIG